MLKNLFSSDTRIGLLTFFLTNPGQDYYLREIHRHLGKTLSAIRKELGNLEAINLVNSWSRGRMKYYRINEEHPLYGELKSMFYKTVALGDVIREELKGIPNIEAAVIYGSVAKNQEGANSDIDLLVIGTPDEDKLYPAVSRVEAKSMREVNFVTFSPAEWREKVRQRNGFAVDILENKTIPLIGDSNAIQRLGNR